MPSQPRPVHIRKTPPELFAKPQNPRGIEGIANIGGIYAKAFFIPTTPMKYRFYSQDHRFFTLTYGEYSQNPQNPKTEPSIECGQHR